MTVYNIDMSEDERREFEAIMLDYRVAENSARNDYMARLARIDMEHMKQVAEFFDLMYKARQVVEALKDITPFDPVSFQTIVSDGTLIISGASEVPYRDEGGNDG